MVQNIDLKTLEYKEFDGANLLDPQYHMLDATGKTPHRRSQSPPSPAGKKFSLAGSHLPYVQEAAAREAQTDQEPIWSLAKPLPRV